MAYLLGLLLVVAGFVLWLAAPMTWRDGEGSIADDGEHFAAWLRRLRWW